MATLEDKILGNKVENYCSSSEDEDVNSDSDNKTPSASSKLKVQEPEFIPTDSYSGNSTNTGPKGVIKDWQRFKQLETEKREEAQRERLELAKKLSITAKTNAEDEIAKQQAEFDSELQELMNDDFLLEFQKKRMAEMLALSGRLPTFGNLINMTSGEQLLHAIDKEQTTVTIILHIYDERITACRTLNNCLQTLAKDYVNVKFCKINGCVAGMSLKFRQHGLPSLLVYKNGQVIGNFVRVSDEFGDEFYASDVESFLIEHAVLPDKSCAPHINSANCNEDEDD